MSTESASAAATNSLFDRNSGNYAYRIAPSLLVFAERSSRATPGRRLRATRDFSANAARKPVLAPAISLGHTVINHFAFSLSGSYQYSNPLRLRSPREPRKTKRAVNRAKVKKECARIFRPEVTTVSAKITNFP